MVETERVLTMDELVTGLGGLRSTAEGEGREVCQAAANVVLAASERWGAGDLVTLYLKKKDVNDAGIDPRKGIAITIKEDNNDDT